jgi:hypothetical protein
MKMSGMGFTVCIDYSYYTDILYNKLSILFVYLYPISYTPIFG